MAFGNAMTVVGNVTRDPELRFTQGGMAIATFGLAWNKRKRDGEDEVSFFNITCFDKFAENVAESITKGTRVVVFGELRQRSWDNQEGERKSAVEIIADEVSPSLRWATVEVQKNDYNDGAGSQGGGSQGGGSQGGGQGGGASRPAPNQAPPAYNTDEEPF